MLAGEGGGPMRRLVRAAILLAVLAALAGFWYYENFNIETEVLPLASSRLPAAFDGLRVVELADLHGQTFGDGDCDLLDAVRAAKPDLIALDGDLADEKTDLESLRPLLEGLAALAPVYYVTGNHEWAIEDREELFSLLEESGVTVLRNEFELWTLDGQSIAVAGVDDPNGPYDQKTPAELVAEIRAACGDVYILMLAHRNDQLDLWAGLGVDTVLTGHAHGGVVRLPGLGGLIGPGREWLPEYTAGLYQQGRTVQLVSRGLGWSAAPVRLFNRPHLPVLVLACMP